MKLADHLAHNDFVLSLSSGFFGFFAHCGFIRALEAANLKPKLITGSSAGAIVAACWASGMSALDMEKEFLQISRAHFWDPGLGAGFLKGETFEKSLRKYLIEDASDAKIPLHLATFDILKRKTKIFKSGDLAKIVRASCAMPVFFHPVKIQKSYYWDGGIQDKMGWSEVAKDELVLGHNLLSSKGVDWFESRKLEMFPNRHILSIKNLPRTGPGYFANGKKAIELSYETCIRFLDKTIHT